MPGAIVHCFQEGKIPTQTSPCEEGVSLACEGQRVITCPTATEMSPTEVNHRITESQNGKGWKGPLWVI